MEFSAVRRELLGAGLKLARASAKFGWIDESKSVVHPRLAVVGRRCSWRRRSVATGKIGSRMEFGPGAPALRYEPL